MICSMQIENHMTHPLMNTAMASLAFFALVSFVRFDCNRSDGVTRTFSLQHGKCGYTVLFNCSTSISLHVKHKTL
jgi:hypothetical protein